MIAYVTKYTLITGSIEAIEVTVPTEERPYTIQYKDRELHKGDWYGYRESANEAAEVMRIKRIGSLKRQILKLERMKFG